MVQSNIFLKTKMINVKAEAFKRGLFESIPTCYKINGQKTYFSEKQIQAFRKIMSGDYSFVGYGGAARGGKSVVIAYAMLLLSLAYPGTTYGLARKELKALKRTTLKTLFTVITKEGLVSGIDFNYNSQDGKIKFSNGSEILLLICDVQHGDPEYSRFGSLELTMCFIDESQEIEQLAITTLSTRVGWGLNREYKIPSVQVECFNPNKGHVYRRFWLPFRDKKELDKHTFIRALPSDNPDPAVEDWIKKTIATNDEILIDRLINGNFDYDDDNLALMPHHKIMDVFTNDFVKPGDPYITADIALNGSDKFIICVWSGWRVIHWEEYAKSDGKMVVDRILMAKNFYKVPMSNVCYDSGGVGNYLTAYLVGALPFNGAKPAYNRELYKNRRNQAYYKLAEIVNDNKIYIKTKKVNKDYLANQLSLVRVDNDNPDAKKSIISKDKIKMLLGGKSPDELDVLMMRTAFEYKGGF